MQTRYILLISAIISVIFSGLATVLPIGFYNQGQVSALYPTLFTPATYTFSIWSLIYLSWLVIGVLQILGKIEISRQNSLLLGSAQILSSLWLIPSQFLLTGTSLIVIIGVLYLLLILFFESRNESQIFKIVADFFLGWIIVASIANLHLVLVSYGIYFFPVEYTLISILLGALLNFYFIFKYKSYTPALVLVWALIGILIGQENIIVQIAAGFGFIGTCISLAYSYFQMKK